MKKKTKRNLYKTNTSSEMEYSKIIKISIGVLIVLGLVYLVTALVMGEIKFGDKTNTKKEPADIQYEEIMAGEVLNRSKNEYYVLMFDFTDTYASYYLNLKDRYEMNNSGSYFYILDLEKKVNEEIILKEGNYTEYPSNISDLKVSSPTLLKINNHKVVTRITGKNNILDFFNDNNK